MVAVSPFVPGLHLNADFDNEVVGSPHGSTPAGRIGPGSDVLGLDTARSTARGWGPQLKAFVAPADVSAVTERFSERLPDSFAGRPARYGWDRLPNKDHVGVAIRVDRVTGQIGVDPTVGFDTIHRLLIPQRKLLEVTGGGVYHDPDRYFACRQITRLDEQSGHQTRVITTRDDPDAALVAHEMWLSRWREEPFFRYMRAHYGHDALDAYETTPDDAGRLVANPARRDADRKVREAAGAIAAAEEHEGRGALEARAPTPRSDRPPPTPTGSSTPGCRQREPSLRKSPSVRSVPVLSASMPSASASWTRSAWRPTTPSQPSRA